MIRPSSYRAWRAGLSYEAEDRLFALKLITIAVLVIAAFVFGLLQFVTWIDNNEAADATRDANRYASDCREQGGIVRHIGSSEWCELNGEKVEDWYRP